MLLGQDGKEQGIFSIGNPLTLNVTFMAHKSDKFNIIPTATLFRLDGILVSNHIGKSMLLEFKSEEKGKLQLHLGNINLGNGNYVFSVALYNKLSYYENSQVYDLIDRSYEFEVIGNDPFCGLFQHPGEWTFTK